MINNKYKVSISSFTLKFKIFLSIQYLMTVVCNGRGGENIVIEKFELKFYFIERVLISQTNL
jgi:hypothetical protein